VQDRSNGERDLHERTRRTPKLVHPRLGRLTFTLDGARLQLGRRALTPATGLAAGVPVIVATANAVRGGWIPGADQAIIATRAYDVFSSHTPLVGQYTLAGQVTGKVTHSLGPMLFWLLALPARFGSPASITWTMGAVNTLAIVGVVALARRRAGVVLMFAAALAVFAELGELRSSFDRMFDELIDRREHTWMPAIDVVRDNGNLVVRADVPGIKPEEVKIEVQDDILTVSGEHEERKEEKDKHYVRRERRYGSFSRSMALPAGVDPKKIKAKTHDGIVEV
jgi:HSP20 family protein